MTTMSNPIVMWFTNSDGVNLASVAIDPRTAWLPKEGDLITLTLWKPTPGKTLMEYDPGTEERTPLTVLRAEFEIFTTMSAGYTEVRYRVILDTTWKPVT